MFPGGPRCGRELRLYLALSSVLLCPMLWLPLLRVWGCSWCLTLDTAGWGCSLCRRLLFAPCNRWRLLSWWSSLRLRVFGGYWISPLCFHDRRYDSRATCSALPSVSRLSFVLGEFSFWLGFGLCLTILLALWGCRRAYCGPHCGRESARVQWLVLLHSRRRIQVHFCWVPAHVEVIGNERADQAAKEAMRMLYPSPISIPYSDFRSIIHFYIKDKWQASWSSLTDNLKLKSIHPSIEKWQSLGITDRRTSILLTRMRIGHTHYMLPIVT